MFLGLYNYTTYLTYLNLLSGFFGISFAVVGKYTSSLIFLLLAGICDMFDGLVSRTKKNSTIFEKRYGIQIDSLADMISFGILPILINYSLIVPKTKEKESIMFLTRHTPFFYLIWFCWGLYLLAALIRLAYYNVLAESDNKSSKKFIGFPVTTVAMVFPFVGFLKMISKSLSLQINDVQILNDVFWFWVHFVCIILLTFLFLCDKIILKKPKAKKTIIIVGIVGIIWIIFFVIMKIYPRK
ncbi:CDP-diacylglycerol-serine O-phosphatidyltransferase [Candidatus Phytoplasma solani]|uniref:CDP-alcohol phosphatidyltransferase family protein n=1 Tax=Candidatus Phytoplasma solani TaxID=69896 RepID=UPI0032DBBAD7